jgi:hypothetical protein
MAQHGIDDDLPSLNGAFSRASNINMTSISKCHRDPREGSKIEGLELAVLGKLFRFWTRPVWDPPDRSRGELSLLAAA